jgi:hypothetical protein
VIRWSLPWLLLACGSQGREAPREQTSPTSSRPVIQPLPDPPKGFAGRWKGACSLTVKCGGETSVDEDSVEIAVVDRGTSLEVRRDACTYLFDRRGATAVMRPGQTCSGEAGRIESWTLMLDPAQRQLSTTMVSRPEASGVACTARAKGLLTRP